MEDGLVYRIEYSYNNYCVRVNDNKIMFISNGKIDDQLNKIRDDYCLYNFIKKKYYRVDDELIVKYVIYFSYKKFVIIV